jgi:hypothetical protein
VKATAGMPTAGTLATKGCHKRWKNEKLAKLQQQLEQQQ